MATTRMNKEIINTASAKASVAASKNKKTELIKERNETGVALYKQLMGEELLAQINTLPIEFKNTAQEFRLGIANSEIGLNTRTTHCGDFYDYDVIINLGDFFPIHTSAYSYRVMFVVNDTNELYQEYKKLSRYLENLNKETNDLRLKVRALLESVKTVEKAIEVWAEGEVYLTDFLKEEKCSLPAVCVTDINEAFKALAI